MKDFKRNYQNKNEKQEVFNYEIANELGAELERNKNMHEKEYQKNLERNNQNNLERENQNNSKNRNPYNNNNR